MIFRRPTIESNIIFYPRVQYSSANAIRFVMAKNGSLSQWKMGSAFYVCALCTSFSRRLNSIHSAQWDECCVCCALCRLSSAYRGIRSTQHFAFRMDKVFTDVSASFRDYLCTSFRLVNATTAWVCFSMCSAVSVHSSTILCGSCFAFSFRFPSSSAVVGVESFSHCSHSAGRRQWKDEWMNKYTQRPAPPSAHTHTHTYPILSGTVASMDTKARCTSTKKKEKIGNVSERRTNMSTKAISLWWKTREVNVQTKVKSN